MQRQWNVCLSLIFEQIRTASLPGMLYDKDAIESDDVKLLGQPGCKRFMNQGLRRWRAG